MKQIFYHEKDLDGWASGALVKYVFKYAELIPYDYHKEKDLKNLLNKESSEIYFVDCSADPKILSEFDKKYNNIYIIDHHKSFIEKAQDFGYKFKGAQKTSRSGCQLTWKYFFKKEEPIFINLLGNYDIWNDEDKILWNELILPFQMAMRLKAKEPIEDMKFWENLIEKDSVKEIINEGKIILKYQQRQDDLNVKRNSFYSYFEGLKLICMNGQRSNSQVFNSIDETTYDIMLNYYRINKDTTTVSLYSKNDIDVSLIAKKYGGGGHKKAAGFICSDMKFNNGEVEVL